MAFLPSGFGIITLRTGAAVYVFAARSIRKSDNHVSSPDASIIANVILSTSGAPRFTRAKSNRSSATSPIVNYLGGTLLHWRYAPSGRIGRRELPAQAIEGKAAASTPTRRSRNHQKHQRFLKAASAPMVGFTPPLTTCAKCLSWDDHS
ncbi:MAG: hypothetical protein M3178_04950 [Pseudomonadota bacterium]|nr:hypothetical protein [Pseudomonadota bacterium]